MWKIADTIPKDQHHNWKLKWRYKFEAYGHSNRAFTRWWWGPDGPCSRDREPKSTRKLGTQPMTDKKLLLRPQTAMDYLPTLTLTEHWPPFCFLFNARLFNALTETHFMNKRLADFERKIQNRNSYCFHINVNTGCFRNKGRIALQVFLKITNYR